MYIPKSFEVNDKSKLMEFIRNNSFGILVSTVDRQPFATHLPFLVREEGDACYLYGHLAKANSHWKEASGEVLALFQGPHAYISPTWYEEPNTVPTWNYVAVHVYGELQLIDATDELMQIIDKTIDFYESSLPAPWQTDLNSEFNRNLLQAVVGFKIKINRLEGKWKLSQNHSVARQQNLIKNLQQSSDPNSREIAKLMAHHLKRNMGD